VIKFSQTIYKIGINPVVDPPDHVLAAVFEKAGRDKGPIPVCGTINGAQFIQTLVKYKGAWRLYINGPMLKAGELKVGDVAEIEIEFDPMPRDIPVPVQFANALKQDKVARQMFDQLTPSRQKEILRYLGSLRSDEALARNVERVISHLKGQDAPTLHGLMRKKKS
jgi:hypothetical protein